ncbi:unnamed protein product [Ophioblennius macclurei]
MILYLLVPALVLGERGNTTEEERSDFRMNLTSSLSSRNISERGNTTEEERSDFRMNLTSSLSSRNISGIKPVNLDRYLEELQGNETLGWVSEDQEGFQEEELVAGQHCIPMHLELSHAYCREQFDLDMALVRRDEWCVMEKVLKLYNHLTFCVEELSFVVNCYFPSPATQDFFLSVHSAYFQNCSQEEEELLEDAPQGLVLTLTLIPVCLIPVLVYMVVWTSKAAA